MTHVALRTPTATSILFQRPWVPGPAPGAIPPPTGFPSPNSRRAVSCRLFRLPARSEVLPSLRQDCKAPSKIIRDIILSDNITIQVMALRPSRRPTCTGVEVRHFQLDTRQSCIHLSPTHCMLTLSSMHDHHTSSHHMICFTRHCEDGDTALCSSNKVRCPRHNSKG